MLTHKLLPKHAERFPAPFGIPLTPSPPAPDFGSAPPSLEGQGVLRVLRCHPGPRLLLCFSTEHEWFHLTPQQCVQSLQLPTHLLPELGAGCSQPGCRAFPFTLPGSAGSQTAASSPRAFCCERDPWPVAAETYSQTSMGLWGCAAKHLGSARGAGGWQDFLGAFEVDWQLQLWVPCKSPNLGWKRCV